MYTVRPALQPYAWGTREDIPALLGMEPTGETVAEAWWGDHPVAPATCYVGDEETTLDRVIAGDPVGALGARLARAYDGRLPFLLKVLAIGSPLSIQAHPSAREAVEGYTREEAARVPFDSPSRVYRDKSHKPELLVALTSVVVLAGFRRPQEILADLGRIDHPDVRGLASTLSGESEESAAIAAYVRSCLRDIDAGGVVSALVRSAHAPDASGNLLSAAAAAEHYPRDGGVLVALAMNRVELAPGEACFVPDGLVHSYQSGMGLEIMANSDNVVRAGLTPKHIDIDELLAVASTVPAPPAPQHSTRIDGADTFRPGAEEFVLSFVRGDHATFAPDPRIVLALEGETRVGAREGDERILARGEAVFVPHSDGDLTVGSSGLAVVAGCPAFAHRG